MASQEKVTYRQLFGNRGFTALWVGQTISGIGDTFNFTALNFLAMSMNKGSGVPSAAPLLTMLMFNTLPYLIISPFAGVFADRWDRKKTMIATDLFRAVLVLLIPLATSLTQLYIIGFLMNVGRIFFLPCIRAALPNILTREQLMLGNSAMSTGHGFAETVGYFVGGTLVAVLGFNVAFYIDSASFFISAAMITMIVLPHVPAAKGKSLLENVQTVFLNLREGFAYISRHRIAQGVFMTNALLQVCIASYNMLETVFVGETLGGGTAGFGLVAGTMTLGFLTGTLVFGGLAHRVNPFASYSWGILGMGIGIALVGSSPNVPVAVVMAFLFGTINPFYFVPSTALLQSNVDNHILGRVFGLFNIINRLAIFLSALGTKSIQESLHWPVGFTIQALGLAGAFGGVLALWWFRSERKTVASKEVPAASA
ncbi:MAG: MFS transporter [Firmicutes bacterium]|nr:MFS transporter [Bacillota bacterium]